MNLPKEIRDMIDAAKGNGAQVHVVMIEREDNKGEDNKGEDNKGEDNKEKQSDRGRDGNICKALYEGVDIRNRLKERLEIMKSLDDMLSAVDQRPEMSKIVDLLVDKDDQIPKEDRLRHIANSEEELEGLTEVLKILVIIHKKKHPDHNINKYLDADLA